MEKLIAFHCAPTLAGIKPSNIINCAKKDYPNIENEILRLNSELNEKGIFFEILCRCGKRALIMVYREKLLREYLQGERVEELLLKAGYPKQASLKGYIDFLKKRINENEDFPHEIGAFLGYPIHDIYGFISSKRCLYTGYWKVYADVERTKERFKRYDICRAALLRRVGQGQSLKAIFGGEKIKSLTN